MGEKTQTWSQYADLRQDLRQTNALNVQILGFLIGGAALILTTAFKETDPVQRSLIFLATYVVTFPGYQLLQGNRRHIWRLATYIRVFLEPNLAHVSWETDVAELGTQTRSPKRLSLSSLVTVNEWSIITLINAVATTACILLGIHQIKNLTLPQLVGFTAGPWL